MKLTKAQQKDMQQVERLIALDRPLTTEEREFVLEHYQEGANQDNAAIGAFFTPLKLARDFAIEVPSDCDTIVDLCAGIGSLSYACEGKAKRIVCVERNAEYVRVGKKVMPHATWVHADVFGDWIKEFGQFDAAISNPPFGNRVKSTDWAGRYTGRTFEYKVIELASRIADWGTFIVPQNSAPFRFSGVRCYREEMTKDCEKFVRETGIVMDANCGIDTAVVRDEWHGASPLCEVVVCDFESIAPAVEPAPVVLGGMVSVPAPMPANADQLDLFAVAA